MVKTLIIAKPLDNPGPCGISSSWNSGRALWWNSPLPTDITCCWFISQLLQLSHKSSLCVQENFTSLLQTASLLLIRTNTALISFICTSGSCLVKPQLSHQHKPCGKIWKPLQYQNSVCLKARNNVVTRTITQSLISVSELWSLLKPLKSYLSQKIKVKYKNRTCL